MQTTKIKEITSYIEEIAPLPLQESYDNAGLIVGDANTIISSILICLDVTEDIVDEAIQLGANLIIAHHPIIFSGLKKLNGKNYVERTVIKAIKNDIAIYAAHTNLDSMLYNGVNTKICEKLGIQNTQILDPNKDMLSKIIVYTPNDHAEKVRQGLFSVGAGHIGNYSQCSFNTEGTGTFQANDNANPFIGKANETHTENETKTEVIIPNHLLNRAIAQIHKTHPYEEPAYDIISLKNIWKDTGMGIIGELPTETDEMTFLQKIKTTFNCNCIRHTKLLNKKINTVAVSGGAGSFLLNKAISANADIFITGDFKYHQFFDAEDKILIADIGHFESEQYTKELFYELITKKFSTFAVYVTKINTNPIKYL